jgi:hypothetical protein
MPNVFVIGLSKTGTTSLTAALRILGYSAKHLPDVSEIRKFDAVADISVAVLFRTLDKWFPGSKFIYTTREEESWLNACERHFSESTVSRDRWFRELRMRVFGCAYFDRSLFTEAYKVHDDRVREYFAGRDDCLVLNVRELGWEPVCAFLGKPVPDLPFPWEKKGFNPSRGKPKKHPGRKVRRRAWLWKQWDRCVLSGNNK